jgi:hypothetical protein
MSDPLPTLSDGLAADRTLTLTTAVSGLLVTGVFWWLAGLVGGLLGGGLALALAVGLLAPLFVFAFGQVFLAVLLPADPSLSLLALGQVPLLAVLLSRRRVTTTAPASLAGSIGLGTLPVLGVVALLAWGTELWLIALAVASGVGAGLYVLHRYALVTLDLVTDRPQEHVRE